MGIERFRMCDSISSTVDDGAGEDSGQRRHRYKEKAEDPVWIEGPHIFKRNGFYYLIAAEGGTGPMHSEVVFRAGSVWGPYLPFKDNPILTQRNLPTNRPDPVTNVGHADFIETPGGDWWAVFLGCRPYDENWFNTGRETFMLPVRWENDWPIVLSGDQTVSRIVDRPNLPAAMCRPPGRLIGWIILTGIR